MTLLFLLCTAWPSRMTHIQKAPTKMKWLIKIKAKHIVIYTFPPPRPVPMMGADFPQSNYSPDRVRAHYIHHQLRIHFCCPELHFLRATRSHTYHGTLLRGVNTQYLLPNFMQLPSSSCVKCQASFPQRCVPGQRKEK